MSDPFSPTADRMKEAATAFLAGLNDEQRAKASFSFDDENERRSWAYFPKDFHGLALREMDHAQRKLAHALVANGLSIHAYAKAVTIIALEDVLNEMEGRGRLRDSGRYFVSIFGAPHDTDRWGWRFEGHHVSLHFTIAGGMLVSPTPIFFGANPAETRHGERAIIRPCGEEEDLARDLLSSLDAAQKRIAILSAAAPPEIVLMNLPRVPELRDFEVVPELAAMISRASVSRPGVPTAAATPSVVRDAVRFERSAPRGIPASALDGRQRLLLSALIVAYVERLPDDLARIEQEKIERAGIEAMHFAWAGDEQPRFAHYYRLQGPSFLVEYNNTQNGNHAHTVWRDADGDFGGDVLREHLRREH